MTRPALVRSVVLAAVAGLAACCTERAVAEPGTEPVAEPGIEPNAEPAAEPAIEPVRPAAAPVDPLPMSGRSATDESPVDARPLAEPRRITAEMCERHLESIRERIPAGFATRIEPPFVVLGDGGAAAVARSSRRTVRWAVNLLRGDFFRDDPERPLEVWLFDGKASYRKHTRMLWNEQPTTPFGYYSRRHGVLVMNIATGGGTLVHEIVHPFVEANVPDCPAWLNEGLGSLFEQCHEQDGRIRGLLNWRLDGLQDAIEAERTISIAELVTTTDGEFYGERSGLNYAMARYLLYWLQERGQLRAFWRDWLRTRERDSSGIAALRRALGETDLAAFQSRWERWLAGLRR